MGARTVTIFNVAVYQVPSHICRIDIIGKSTTHGWQVRYGKPWKMFSDGTKNGSGAAESLKKAITELEHRIATLPAPSGIRKVISNKKTSDLPLGLSGPFKRQQQGKSAYYYLQLSLPVFGKKAEVKQIYLGNENTYTVDRL